MPLLLGEPPKTRDFIPIDRTEIYFDNNRENYALHLVGVRKFFQRPYKWLAKSAGLSSKGYSDLEFSVAISDVPSAGNRTNLLYYLEINPFTATIKTIDNGALVFQKSKRHYGIIEQTKGHSKPPEKVITLERNFLFPSMSTQPFYKNIVSRKTLFDWIEVLNNKKDQRTLLQGMKEFYDYITNVFAGEDLTCYKKIDRRQIPSPDNEYPVFSLYRFGRENIEELLINWRSMSQKAIHFLVGTDQHIKAEVPSVDQHRLHFVQLIGSAAGLPASVQLLDPDNLFYSGIIAGIFWTGLFDGAYRMYKNETNHSAPRSGIIGGMYEKFMHKIPLF
ncbi:MAG: hypothetical protein RL557_771 [archaeon]